MTGQHEHTYDERSGFCTWCGREKGRGRPDYRRYVPPGRRLIEQDRRS